MRELSAQIYRYFDVDILCRVITSYIKKTNILYSREEQMRNYPPKYIGITLEDMCGVGNCFVTKIDDIFCRVITSYIKKHIEIQRDIQTHALLNHLPFHPVQYVSEHKPNANNYTYYIK